MYAGSVQGARGKGKGPWEGGAEGINKRRRIARTRGENRGGRPADRRRGRKGREGGGGRRRAKGTEPFDIQHTPGIRHSAFGITVHPTWFLDLVAGAGSTAQMIRLSRDPS